MFNEGCEWKTAALVDRNLRQLGIAKIRWKVHSKVITESCKWKPVSLVDRALQLMAGYSIYIIVGALIGKRSVREGQQAMVIKVLPPMKNTKKTSLKKKNKR